MGFLIGLFTVAMVLDCIALIFLVLIQLPKKEAGAGLAFGAGTTDALFGAGSGNVLTKITKYAAGIFFALAVLLSLMQRSHFNRNATTFQQNLGQQMEAPAGLPSRPAALPPALSNTNAAATNMLSIPVPEASTNQLSIPSTNAPK